jgi:anthranilate synthase component 1
VRRAKEYIAAGDIFQVVLSRQRTVPCALDPFSVYRALRMVNPSPYMFFLKEGVTAVAGASPEMLFRVEGRRVETRPLAGTRPRGVTAKRMRASRRSSSPTRRSAPSISCWWTSAATTSGASARSAP